MFLDATDEMMGDVTKAVDKLLKTVRPTEKSASSKTPYPPIVMFIWGTSKPFIGFVENVTVKLTLFRSDGRPVRASCTVKMKELAPSPPPQNPTSGALEATRAHTVVLGDSLASIANAEYGTPTMWRSIAIANRLEDPFNLRVGRQLLCPARRRPQLWPEVEMAQHGTNAFKIDVDGSPLPDAVAAALIEAYVEDELNLPDAVELVFRDPQRTLIEAGRFAIGKKLKVSVTSEAAAGGALIFDGEITTLEAEVERDRSVAVVRGLDPAHRLQRGTNTETHLDVTYGDVVGKVAQRCGLQQGDGGKQLRRPRSRRAVEPDGLGVPVQVGRRDRARDRGRRSQAAPARAEGVVGRSWRRGPATPWRSPPARRRRQPRSTAGHAERRRAGR